MRFTVPLLIIGSLGICLSSVSFADVCREPAAPVTFPDAATATQAEILAAQQSVKQYLSEMEAVLQCMQSANQEQAYGAAVEDMKKVAAKFNAVLHAFRAKQSA